VTGVSLRDSIWEEEMVLVSEIVVVNDRVPAEIDLLLLVVLVLVVKAFTCTGMIKRKK